MNPLLITCTITGRKVQVLVPDAPETASAYQSVACPACKGVHLVQPRVERCAATED